MNKELRAENGRAYMRFEVVKMALLSFLVFGTVILIAHADPGSAAPEVSSVSLWHKIWTFLIYMGLFVAALLGLLFAIFATTIRYLYKKALKTEQDAADLLTTIRKGTE